MSLTREGKEFVKDALARNSDFDYKELTYMLRRDIKEKVTFDTVKEFVQDEETQEEIETLRSMYEKKAEVTKQDLVNELVSLKKQISEQVESFEEAGQSRSMNDAVKNILKTIELIGEVTDALKEKERVNNNLVKVDSVEQNINFILKNMPRSKKKKLVKDLTDDVGLKVLEDDD